MPFKSIAQERYLYANHPEVAKEFAAHTPSNLKLPDHVNESSPESKLEAMKQLVQQQMENK